MRTPPAGLAVEELVGALADGWRVDVASIEYVPEGGGTHHWLVVDRNDVRHFVNVDDLDDKSWAGDTRAAVGDRLRRALDTSSALRREAALDFVVAPVPDRDGTVARDLTDRHVLSLFPYLDGHSHPFGPYTDAALRGRVLDMLVRLHGATDSVATIAPDHELTYSGRHEVEELVRRPTSAWDSGPFAADAYERFVLHVGGIAEVVHAFESLAGATEATRTASQVITHGEPHPANLLFVGDDVHLIDWDTAAMAPPERDLSLLTDDAAHLSAYERATGHAVDAAVLLLYRARWYVDDLGSLVRWFHQPHVDSADTRRYLAAVEPHLAALPVWVQRLAQT